MSRVERIDFQKIIDSMPKPTPEELEARERERQEKAERRMDGEQRYRFSEAGFPVTREDRRRLESNEFEETFAVKTVLGWLAAESGPNVLVLFGGVGSGKTFASAVWAWRMARGREYKKTYTAGDDTFERLVEVIGVTVEYFTPDTLSRRVRPWPNTEEFEMEPLGSIPIVLDDVGTEQDKRFPAALFEVVNNHQDSRMIMTTNLTVKEFHARYDPRVIDRLNACGKAVVVPGKSLRKKTGGFG